MLVCAVDLVKQFGFILFFQWEPDSKIVLSEGHLQSTKRGG